jgi:hypothetical protein
MKVMWEDSRTLRNRSQNIPAYPTPYYCKPHLRIGIE